jgi:coproporphyrinogen III oxidase-like Fe-S oxidoreductase
LDPIGLYLHVPFCATRCPYCDFFTRRPVGDALTVYAETMKTELRDTRDQQLCADSDNLTIHIKKFFPLINNYLSDSCNGTLYECVNIEL